MMIVTLEIDHGRTGWEKGEKPSLTRRKENLVILQGHILPSTPL
jgi:hypothetical protein